MAQPTAYTRQYNFNDFATTSPSDPLPGVQVDNELNSVLTNLSGLNTNIAKIQQDDGKIKNQSVHKNAFDVDALALIGLSGYTVGGTWSAGQSYTAGTLVTFNAATYLAVSAHTSSVSFTTDLNAGRWILLANAAINTSASAVDKFEGNGTQNVFTLSFSYSSVNDIQVFVNGALRNPTDEYTVSGNQLTLATPPSAPSVSGNENVIVWGANVALESAKNSASTSAATATTQATLAQNYAIKVDGAVTGSEFSSKANAVGGTGVTSQTGSAKEWAIGGGALNNTNTVVDSGNEYSAKAYAVGSINRYADNGGVASDKHSAKDWATYINGTNTLDGTNFSAKYYAQQAANSVEGFDEKYYGSYANDAAAEAAHTAAGRTVAAGDLYFNTTNNALRFYNGTSWADVAAVDVSTFVTAGFSIAMSVAL